MLSTTGGAGIACRSMEGGATGCALARPLSHQSDTATTGSTSREGKGWLIPLNSQKPFLSSTLPSPGSSLILKTATFQVRADHQEAQWHEWANLQQALGPSEAERGWCWNQRVNCSHLPPFPPALLCCCLWLRWQEWANACLQGIWREFLTV